jgi:hypothetical protein
MSTRLRLAAMRTEVPPGEIKAATPAPAFADVDPPLGDGLGSLTFKITTASPEAQSFFDQGLRLAYAFNHGEAQRSFRKAQKLDSVRTKGARSDRPGHTSNLSRYGLSPSGMRGSP